MTAPTNTARLRALGATEGDWGEPSTWAPTGYGFAGTGTTRSLTHLAAATDYYQNEALCGVGVAPPHQEQTLDVILDRALCRRCLAALGRIRDAKEEAATDAIVEAALEDVDILVLPDGTEMDRFYPIDLTRGPPVAACNLCAALIIDDDEGSNRADHVAALHPERTA